MFQSLKLMCEVLYVLYNNNRIFIKHKFKKLYKYWIEKLLFDHPS